MKIAYNNNNAKKCYQKVDSIVIGFKPRMLLIREKAGNVVSNKKNALQRWSENLRSISNSRWNRLRLEKSGQCFIYLFKLISIHPVQVHTMGMERVTFIIHPQAVTI